MNLFSSIYFTLVRLLFKPAILKKLGVREARILAFEVRPEALAPRPPEGAMLTWFHAASVGELEMLFPLIEAFHQKGILIGVTAFSDSALPFLAKFPDGIYYKGLSPRDDRWGDLFRHFRVNRILVSKYEAWPGLWLACVRTGIPLILINAQWRRSLRVVRNLFRLFFQSLPRLAFFAVDQKNAHALKKAFPDATVELSADPRWLRALNRQELSSPRVVEWKEKTGSFPRPFFMVGSAWLSDLERVVPAFRDFAANSVGTREGTLWVIPHSLTDTNLKTIESYLNENIPGHFVLVKEMGILLELYSLADRIFVGGGFEKGIHSTLEAGIYPVPVACGPKNVEFFFETGELSRNGQLTVCRNTEDILHWMRETVSFRVIEVKQKREACKRLVEQSLQLR